MSEKIAIVAVVYHEPDYTETRKCIQVLNLPTVYMERNPVGVGSLAAAINAGFIVAKNHYNPEYVWFVTNCVFSMDMVWSLARALDKSVDCAAVHPCFDSDHAHLRPQPGKMVTPAPFVEFTAPMVRASVFANYPLDQDMPYVGHDLDWAYRVREAGYFMMTHHGEKLGHTYIRKKRTPNEFTRRRMQMRKATDAFTIKCLEIKYGKDWRNLMQYHNGIASK